MTIRSLPLRYWVPGALLLLALALTAFAFVHDWLRADRAVEELTRRRAIALGSVVSPTLERLLGRDAVSLAAAEVARMVVVPNLNRALVLDETNRVQCATDFTLPGQALRETPAAGAEPLVARARETQSAQTEITRDGATLRAAFPFPLNPLPGELRASRLAVLYTETDLGALVRVEREDIVRRTLVMGMVTLLFCFAAWFYFHTGFARRLDQLVAGVAAFSSGSPRPPVSAAGQDELAQIGRAVNEMAANLAAQTAAVRESEQRLRGVLETALDAIITIDAKGVVIEFNPAAEKMFGYRRDAALGRPMAELIIPPALRDAHYKGFQRYLSTGEARILGKRIEVPAVRSDGTEFEVELAITRIAQEGAPLFTAYVRDITERKRVEAALRASETRLRIIFDTEPECVKLLAADGSLLEMNPAGLRMIEADSLELVKNHCVYPLVVEEHRAAFCQLTESVFRGEAGALEFQLTGLKGGQRWLATHATPLRDESGRVTALLAVTRDITEHKRAELASHESEARFRELAETIEEVFWITSPDKNRMLYVSPAYEKIWGRTCASLYESPHTWLEAIHPDDRERVLRAAEARQTRGDYDETYRILRPDASVRWIHDKAFPIFGAEGEVLRIVGLAEDITGPRQLEEQFRQSQKMEAFGQLAGGVAHDFNNILAVIMMQVELTGLSKNLPEEVQDDLRQILASAERAADLTRQLLLFSRKQVMQPRKLDLNELVTSLDKMLQRVIGEDVRLQLNLHPRPLFIRADAGMLDQVLMNLVINARDAMPGGGQIVIETSEKTFTAAEAAAIPDAAPGSHVCLRVTDTGGGMPPEILAHIFEPFFTTKEPGKGTGLGLATVFGIVKQHNGALTVESEVGQGTMFRIFLRAQEVTAQARAQESLKTQPLGGAETILLAEDEPSVRMLTRIVLERAGYRVLEAAHGVEALQIWEREAPTIQLLLTDLVMPEGLSGRALAARLQTNKPGLRVIFTSGYSAEIAGRELALQEGQNFLQKPASAPHILETVRRCLDG